MRFIAFAYLYHYLNWFSKTSIIKWNRIACLARSPSSIMDGSRYAMYANDSRTGLVILMTLSFAHGFLELPLDHQTFFNLFKEMRPWPPSGLAKLSPINRSTNRVRA